MANKTTQNSGNVAEYLLAIESEQVREDSEFISKLMEEVVGEAPKILGDTLIGFGSYHYVYDSGREGDHFKVGFAPRKAKVSIYINSGFDHVADEMEILGKYKAGKSCLHIKKLSDVDIDVLKNVIAKSVAWIEEKYPAEI